MDFGSHMKLVLMAVRQGSVYKQLHVNVEIRDLLVNSVLLVMKVILVIQRLVGRFGRVLQMESVISKRIAKRVILQILVEVGVEHVNFWDHVTGMLVVLMKIIFAD
jgi:hypothetical protein